MERIKATPQLLPITEAIDERGVLSYLECNNPLPFVPQRTFWITQVPPTAQRGGHAHRTCHEFLVAMCGSFIVECYDGVATQTYHLSSHKHEGLWIPCGVWCKLHSFSPDSICLVVASEPYDASGYIHSKEEYEAYINTSHTLR